MKKRPYLLFELLVAFFIVSFCSLPLIHSPLCLVRKDIASLEKMELELESERTFAQIKADLYAGVIRWIDLPKEEGEKIPHSSRRFYLDLKDISNAEFKESVFFKLKSQKKGKAQEEFRLVDIEIVFEPVHKHQKIKKIKRTHAVFLTKSAAQDSLEKK